MASRPWLPLAFALGLLVGAAGTGAALLGFEKPRLQPVPTSCPPSLEDDDDDAMAANAALVSSLQECNRQLKALTGKQAVPSPAAAPPAESGRSGRDRRSLVRPAPSSDDWARYAREGVVPYRIPCLRSTPFSPTARQLDRLGLAPQDADAVKEAYAKSNERMAAQIRPLCASVLGGEQAADRIGASACVKAITDSARRESPDKMKEGLVRVAEVNAGQRPAPSEATPLESLLMSFTLEAKTFESDLAARIGAEDARLVAGSRSLCSDTAVVSAVEREGRARTPAVVGD